MEQLLFHLFILDIFFVKLVIVVKFKNLYSQTYFD